MQAGSTGLGKQTLKMRMLKKDEKFKYPPTKPPEGSFCMYMKTYDPVVWNVWIVIEPQDIWPTFRAMLSWKAVAFFVTGAIKGLFSKNGKDSKKQVVEGAARKTVST
ncbi:hypothetical protein ACFL2E_05485 [Thermodesulfobacteriota bacterium]